MNQDILIQIAAVAGGIALVAWLLTPVYILKWVKKIHAEQEAQRNMMRQFLVAMQKR